MAALVALSAVAAAVLPAGAAGPTPGAEAGVDAVLLAQASALGAEYERRGLVVHDAPWADWLSALGASLAPPVTDSEVVYRFRLLRDPTPNAFALPDGQVFVNTGMLALLDNEAEVAALLAHEISHVTAHHGQRGSRSANRRELASTVMSAMLNQLDGVVADVFDWGQSAATQLSLAGYSRELELEADRLGLELLTARGDVAPSSMYALFQRLRHSATVRPEPRLTLVRSHPRLDERLDRLAALAAAGPASLRPAAAVPEDARLRYARFVEPLVLEVVRASISGDAPYAALEFATRLVRALPGSGPAHLAAGDAWLALGPLPTWPSSERTRVAAHELARSRRRTTREERWREALDAPDGRVTLARHLAEAESHYRRALELDASLAAAWRGLGQVMELRAAHHAAADAYFEYLRLQPAAVDRALVRARASRLAQADLARGDGARVDGACAGRDGVVLPAGVDVLEKRVGLDSPRSELLPDLEREAAEATLRAFRAAGHRVRAVGRESLVADPTLAALHRAAEQRFAALYPALARRPRAVGEGRYSLGREARRLAQALDADLLVFQRVEVTAAAGGQLTRAMLLSTLTFLFRDVTGATHTDVVTVDGCTGLVVDYREAGSRIISRRALETRPLAAMVTASALRDLPAVLPIPPPSPGPGPLEPARRPGESATLARGPAAGRPAALP